MYKWEAEGDARAVIVIVHGAMEHQGRYKWLVEMWRSEGYHVNGRFAGSWIDNKSEKRAY